MKQNKETLKKFFETGDKPTQQQYADLIESYIDAQQPVGEANRRFVIDETGEVSVTTASETVQYQAGTNITIDNTNAQKPIINASGGGASDNLGNHIATQNLDMGNHQILNVERINGKISNGIGRIDLGSYTRVLGQLDASSLNCTGVITGSLAQLTGTSGVLLAGNTIASGTNASGFRIGATADNKVVFGQRNTSLAGLIDVGKITATREYEMPDKNGKIALLDDIPVKANFYEEGTSTVQLVDQSGGATYSFTTEVVEYIRVGNQVTATIAIEDVVTSGTPTGFLRLETPIFTSFPVAGPVGWDPNISTFSGGNVNYYSIAGQMSVSGMYFQYQDALDNTNVNVMSAVNFVDGRLRLTVTYKTNVYTS